jgi:hypothetical protein
MAARSENCFNSLKWRKTVIRVSRGLWQRRRIGECPRRLSRVKPQLVAKLDKAKQQLSEFQRGTPK